MQWTQLVDAMNAFILQREIVTWTMDMLQDLWFNASIHLKQLNIKFIKFLAYIDKYIIDLIVLFRRSSAMSVKVETLENWERAIVSDVDTRDILPVLRVSAS